MSVIPTEAKRPALNDDEARTLATRSFWALIIILSWPVAIVVGVLGNQDNDALRYGVYALLALSWIALIAVYRCPRCNGYLGSAMRARFCPKCRVQLRGNP